MKDEIFYSKLFSSFNLFILLFSITFFSYFVVTRGLYVGSDTYNYYIVFNQISSGINFDYEIGFIVLNKIAAFLTNYYGYLLLVYFLININFIFSFFQSIRNETKNIFYISCAFLSFFGFLYWSNWFYSANINGIRQGIALSFLYISLISFLFNKKKSYFILFFILACFFHNSIFLVIPFLLLIFIKKFKYNFITVSIFSFLYFTGLNEFILLNISNLTGLEIYNMIKFYTDEGGQDLWYGFNWGFFLYSIFWFYVPLFLVKIRVMNFSDNLNKILSIYGMLVCVFLFFGFAGFSNRYGFISWLFLPFVQTFMLLNLNISFRGKIILSYIVLFSGFLHMYSWFFKL